MELATGRESPQFGGGSAGTLQIETDNGTDKLQYTATNFIPGLDTKAGLHFGDWTPRVGISGPIEKGHTQVNLNATNILYADLLTNFDHFVVRARFLGRVK